MRSSHLQIFAEDGRGRKLRHLHARTHQHVDVPDASDLLSGAAQPRRFQMLLELQPGRFHDVPHAAVWIAVGRHEPRRGLQQVVILNPVGSHAGLNGSPTGQEDLHVELDLDEEAQLHAQVSIEVRSQGVERRHGQQLLGRRIQGVLPEPPRLGSVDAGFAHSDAGENPTSFTGPEDAGPEQGRSRLLALTLLCSTSPRQKNPTQSLKKT